MLDSDLNNTKYADAVTNPDRMLYVEFYMHKPLDKWATEEASQKNGMLTRIYGLEQPFVRIMKPGDSTTIHEVPVREEHKRRWPEDWLYFQMAHGLVEEQEIPGWKIEEWPYLMDKSDMLREFKHGRFRTVEQVAGASDAQVQKMGIGGLGFREQARADLRKKLGADLNEAIVSKDKEVAEMKAAMEAMQKQLQELTEKRGPGRPPKEVNG